MYPMRNRVQRYDWGSLDRIPRLLGVEPDGTPQAELWLGAHPAAPSEVWLEGQWVSLPELIARDPRRVLGTAVLTRFGATLPFLFKVLAAAEPLSLQVHPNLAQARAGFERENAAGVAIDDPRRSYRDANHKPELLCALDHFDVLSGFRRPEEAAAVLEAFGLAGPWAELARTGGAARACSAMWDLPLEQQQAMAAVVIHAAGAGTEATRRFARDADVVRRAAARHRGDVGVAVALCLNRTRLLAGQGTFAGAGQLHAYLEGFGVEIMANSDNVVRAGLTTKAVDVAELRRLLVTEPSDLRPIEPRLDEERGEASFETMTDEFALSSFLLEGDPVQVDSPGPEILLCTDGGVDVRDGEGGGQALERGGSLFIPAAVPRYEVHGVGTLFRARVGLLAHANP